MADVHEKVVAEVAKIGQTQPNFSILDKTQPVTVQFAPSLAEFVPTLTSFDAISAQPPRTRPNFDRFRPGLVRFRANFGLHHETLRRPRPSEVWAPPAP